MRSRISIRGYVRPSVGRSVRRSVTLELKTRKKTFLRQVETKIRLVHEYRYYNRHENVSLVWPLSDLFILIKKLQQICDRMTPVPWFYLLYTPNDNIFFADSPILKPCRRYRKGGKSPSPSPDKFPHYVTPMLWNTGFYWEVFTYAPKSSFRPLPGPQFCHFFSRASRTLRS